VDTDLIVHEGISCTPEEITDEIFQEMEKTASYPRVVKMTVIIMMMMMT
jgi:hypothetical protein